MGISQRSADRRELIPLNVIEAREALGMSQLELGRALGHKVDSSPEQNRHSGAAYVNHLEHGKLIPRTIMGLLLCELLMVDIDYLVGFEDEPAAHDPALSPNYLARNLKGLREKKRWTQDRLRRRMDASVGWVSSIENETIEDPRLDYLADAADAFRVSPSSLLTREAHYNSLVKSF